MFKTSVALQIDGCFSMIAYYNKGCYTNKFVVWGALTAEMIPIEPDAVRTVAGRRN
jgi:hypothetical protein